MATIPANVGRESLVKTILENQGVRMGFNRNLMITRGLSTLVDNPRVWNNLR